MLILLPLDIFLTSSFGCGRRLARLWPLGRAGAVLPQPPARAVTDKTVSCK